MRLPASLSLVPLLLVACSSPSKVSGDGGTPSDGGAATDASGVDAAIPHVDAGPQDTACAGPCPASSIKHLVIIVQENHTFDDHFGAYCTAPPGSNPTCNDGPACCEAMPATDPTGVTPTVLTDAEHGSWDPNHAQACELAEIDDGKMDGFAASSADGGGVGCSSPENIAVADPTLIKPYWDFAAYSALGDRYFQSVAGQSSSNDMYLARGKFVFLDNSFSPQGTPGLTCDVEATLTQYTDPTIGDLLNTAQVPWTWFYDGYAAMVAANGSCPPKPTDCPFALPFYPCAMDPSDVPFYYYASLVNTPFIQDYAALTTILDGSGELPAVSFVKALGYRQEHPGFGTTLSAGVNWASALIDAVEASRFRDDTLVVLTYDEGGGYFDHVSPPPASSVDGEPYGMRLPFLAVGPMVRPNFISHVQMEHSSLVKFIEWNWLGQQVGQLGTRDAVANNIGSVLDPSATGVAVPEN